MDSALVTATTAGLRALAAHPAQLADPALHGLREAFTAAASSVAASLLSAPVAAMPRGVRAAAAASAAAAVSPPAAARAGPPARARQYAAPILEEVAPYIAQTGHHTTALVLSRVTRSLRTDERTWRAISRLVLGFYRRTFLAFAAHTGNLERSQFLVNHGATVNARDAFGRSPLTEALAGSHAAVAAFLRNSGAVEDVVWRGVVVRSVDLEDDGPADVFLVLSAELLAVGHHSNCITVRSIGTGTTVLTLVGHTSRITALELLPGNRLASASSDESIRLWRLDTGKCEAALLGHEACVNALAVLRDERLVSGGDDGMVRIWNTTTGALEATLEHTKELTGEEGFSVNALIALPRGGFAGGCSHGGDIVLWNKKCKRTGVLQGEQHYRFSDVYRSQHGDDDDYLGGATSLSLLPDGRLAASHDNGYIVIWHVRDRRIDALLNGSYLQCLAVLPSGHLLSGGSTLELWDERALIVRGGGFTSVRTTVPGMRINNALAVLRNGSVVVGGWHRRGGVDVPCLHFLE